MANSTFFKLPHQRYRLLWLLLVLIYFVGYSFSHFLAAGRDDTFIMLWAGQSLGQGPWFVNFNYESQEIASSYLGVFIASLTKGLPLTYALLLIKLMSLAAACATLVLLWSKCNALFSGFSGKPWLVMGAVLATAVSPIFQYWTFGGLETPYHALLLLAFCLVFVRSITYHQTGSVDWWLVGVGCLLVLARTESFWPLLLAGGLSAVINRFLPVHTSTVRALYLSGAFFILIMVLRYVFTGALWPNPVYAKVGSFESAIPIGWKYLLDYYNSSPWGWLQGLAFIYGIAALVRVGICAVSRDKPGVWLINDAVMGSILLFHQLFVLLSGGNWMEYFRFMSAIVPLLNILVFSMVGVIIGRVRAAEPHKLYSNGLMVASLILPLTQVGRIDNSYAGNCAKPLVGDIFVASIDALFQRLILNNCTLSRDWYALKPFLDSKLPELLQEADGHLTVASSQAGFFPYFIRQKYTQEQIWFIDSAGLNELQIAKLPGRKNSWGNLDGFRIDLALLGKSGALSEYLQKHPLDLVYLISVEPIVRENFLSLGYKVVWDKRGAVVFFRSPRSIDMGLNKFTKASI